MSEFICGSTKQYREKVAKMEDFTALYQRKEVREDILNGFQRIARDAAFVDRFRRIDPELVAKKIG